MIRLKGIFFPQFPCVDCFSLENIWFSFQMSKNMFMLISADCHTPVYCIFLSLSSAIHTVSAFCADEITYEHNATVGHCLWNPSMEKSPWLTNISLAVEFTIIQNVSIHFDSDLHILLDVSKGTSFPATRMSSVVGLECLTWSLWLPIYLGP